MRKARRPRRSRDIERALIEAAENVFAEQGVEAGSLRKIATLAGSGNSCAVHYHFGGRKQLVEAIFRYRLSEFELQRATLLQELTSEPTLAELLTVAWKPLVYQQDQAGVPSYANFLFSLRHSSLELTSEPAPRELTPALEWARQPVRKPARGSAFHYTMSDLTPIVNIIRQRIRKAVVHLDEEDFTCRSNLQAGMSFDAIRMYSRGQSMFSTRATLLQYIARAGEAILQMPSVLRESKRHSKPV